MFDIKEELKKLPELPGVYLMKDENKIVIYVGKAKNLKNRVPSYFRSMNSHTPKTIELVSKIESFEYIVTGSEVEALIVESNLIKKYQPKYNILLKDSKSYPYIKIEFSTRYPKIESTRIYKKDKDKDKDRYFGPFVDVSAMNEVLEIVSDTWKIRSCDLKLPRDKNKSRPCLNYHIKRCSAPCADLISEEDYLKQIDDAIDFLNGDTKNILRELTEQMHTASENLQFERAAIYRDKINAISRISERKTVSRVNENNQDIISVATKEDKALVLIFMVRNGKMLGKEQFLVDNLVEDEDEILESFLNQYYSDISFIPKAIVLEKELKNQSVIEQRLSMLRESNVKIVIPKKGEKLRLLNLCKQNAEITLLNFGKNLEREYNRTIGALEEIKDALKINVLPRRIEAIDISNTSGVLSVGSMVVFENGVPKSSDYRKFKIKTVVGANDVLSIAEVVERRFNRYINEKVNGNETKFSILPDLLLIDGGENQVNFAKNTLKKLNLDIIVAGMIKDDKHRTRGLFYEGEEILLNKSSEGFKLLTRIQDEVHRFAISYHKQLRSKNQVKTVLSDIDGLGEKRITALLRHFGSVENIKNAKKEELMEVESINSSVADNILLFFSKEN